MQHIWASKRKPITITLSHGEWQLLMACLDKAVPMLVYEHTTDWDWCYCPHCHTILNREYMKHCDCCGQTLSWHGSKKHAVRLTFDEILSLEQKEDNPKAPWHYEAR